MSSGILHRTLQAPTAVTAACSLLSTASAGLVVLLQDTRLTLWRAGEDGLEQTAAWRAPCSILHMRLWPSQHLLLLAEDGLCYLHSISTTQQQPVLLAHAQLQVPADMSASQVQPFGCVMSTNSLSAASGTGVASLSAVAHLSGVLHVIKAAPAAAGAGGSGADAGAMRLEVKALPLTHALLSCHYPGGHPPELASVRVSCCVLALTWLTPAEQQLDLQGRSLLAVLHEFTVGSQPPVLHVDCVAVNWLEGSVHPGPWSLRNVHPTTRLLQPFPGSTSLPPGVLAISSRGVQLCTCLGSSLVEQQQQQQQQQQQEPTSSKNALEAAAAAAAAGGEQAAVASTSLLAAELCVQQHDVVLWTLQGLPLSCISVSDSCWLVGDSRAGLHMLQLPACSSTASWQQLKTSGCMSIPDVLLHVPLEQPQQGIVDSKQEREQQHEQPDHGRQQQLAGLLLVGSKCSSSQVLGLPRNLWSQAMSSSRSVLPQQQQWVLPVLQSALLPSLAGAQAVAVYTDPSGALPEQQLLVACGVSPRGKLAAVRSGMGLLPVMLDGPELPGDAVLFAIRQPQPCQHQQQSADADAPPLSPVVWQQHSMLGFSFPSVCSSSVMSVEGQTFRQLALSGLSQHEASLLLDTTPGGWLLQVTAGCVRVLHPSLDWQLHSQWTPTGSGVATTISLAALCGSHLVVACGSHLTCLVLDCCQGTLTVAATAQLEQQASALNLFRLQDGQLLVAAGLWVDNTLLLMTLPPPPLHEQQQQQPPPPQLHVVCSVALEADQPRSITLLPVGGAAGGAGGGAGADVLLVGSNTGRVIMWQVVSTSQHDASQQPQQGQQGSITLRHARAVQVGNVSVSLQQTWLPAASGEGADSPAADDAMDIPTSSSNSSQLVVPCVVAHAGAMAVFKPNAALLAALRHQQQRSQGNTAPADPAAAELALGLAGATACVDVSRLCGSEACLGASPVHTPDMPHSLAWVSHSHRLCFGSIAAEHKLRWRSCGLAATPLAMVVHERSDTIVVLLSADELHAQASPGSQQPQQQLVVLDAKSLRPLMALALAPGHVHTMLQVLDLPATSTQQQRQQQVVGSSGLGATSRGGSGAESAGVPGAGAADSLCGRLQQQQEGCQNSQQPGCLPFIVLGSHAVVGPAPSSNTNTSPPSSQAHQKVGLLSVFELRTAVVQLGGAAAAAGEQQQQPQQQQQRQVPPAAAAAVCSGSELRYELVLHGIVPLDATPASACTVVPQLVSHTQLLQQPQGNVKQQQQQQQQASGSRGSQSGGQRESQAGAAAAGAAAAVAAAVGAAPTAAAPLPLLAVGSEAGVSLLRVVVDDAAWSERQQQEQLSAQVEQVPSLNLSAAAAQPPAQQQQQQHSQPTPPPAAPHACSAILSPAHRYGRLLLQELSTEGAAYRGVVTKLLGSSSTSSSVGDDGCIVACESLGPVTTFKALALQPNGWVQLLPVGVDSSSKLMTADFVLEEAVVVGAHSNTEAGGGLVLPAAGQSSSRVSSSSSGQQQQQPASSTAPAQQSQHRAILVATHPAGLMLLQRDLQQEQQHTLAALQAAQGAWEAGRRPRAGGLSVLMDTVQQGGPGMQPWQGAGEMAPMMRAWADQVGLRPMAGLQGQDARGAMAAQDRGGGGGVAVQTHDVRADVLGLMSASPEGAPPLLPSAACAPAPGSTLLCAAQLGLHSAPIAQADNSSSISGSADVSNSSSSGAFSTGGTVLCLSASGGVAAAQLLPPQQCLTLTELQQQAVCQQSFTLSAGAEEQPLDLGQAAASGSSSNDTSGKPCSTQSLAQWQLRGAVNPDAAASYEAYERTPGAIVAAGVTSGARRQQQHLRHGRLLGVVDGDVLLRSVAGHQLDAAAALQHVLWQHAL